MQRKYGQFEKFAGNPVMNGSLYGTVLRTADGGYSMYHQCATTICFANSSDGIVWTQPKGLVKQFGPKQDVLLTRLGSADQPNQQCTAALGAVPTSTSTSPRRHDVGAEIGCNTSRWTCGCVDVQPSVLYTPWESKRNATFQMFNFVSILHRISISRPTDT